MNIIEYIDMIFAIILIIGVFTYLILAMILIINGDKK